MAKPYKTALVTGGAGFIGSHIVDALIKRHIRVIVVDDLSNGKRENVNPNAKFVKLSLTHPQFPALLKRLQPDIIFHLAARISVRESVQDPSADATANIFGTLALIQNAHAAGVKKIIFSSTGGAMYPDARPPFSERVEAQPMSPYAIAKRASEMYLGFMHRTLGIPCICLRYANVYGPRQDSHGEAGVIAIFTQGMLKGKALSVNGTGKQTRDFVYVGDVVRANMLAMARPVSGIFNIGTGKETNINTLFKKLKSYTGTDTPVHHGPAQQGEVMRSALDFSRARKVLKWEPQMKLDEGLKRTVLWFANKKHV